VSVGELSFSTNGSRYAIAVEGLAALTAIEGLDDQILRNAARAINSTADRGRTMSARAMLTQVNFPASYLNPGEGRLVVTNRAAGLKLNATIRGRDQPTSLARFVSGSKRPLAKGGLTIEVKPGHARFMKRAFIMPLKNGNKGLAMRTAGPAPDRAYKPRRIAPGLYLLYGPSVDQVFSSVRGQVSPDLLQFLEDEFSRLMEAGI
jgi:hypothetical protein